ncbi:MAG TPA: cysteine desulfurase NifS [Clostridia bacterium]|nr:cysteine desulfurase NifS [Clostridia bacterium]
MSKLIYLDNAATTSLDPDVLNEMMPWLQNGYGNPSSIYSIGRDARKAIEEARGRVAAAIGSKPNEIYFTGSGSESDNWAIKGIADAYKDKGRHMVTTNIEHHAVLHVFEYMEKQGFEVTYVPVENNGIVDVSKIMDAVREDTILVSVMMANNEIGTIQPIAEIGARLKDHQAFFHTDAVQAIGNIPVDVSKLNVDLLSLTAHKFHGPKGTGALYIKRGVKIGNLLHGGGQERTRRASTENTAGIIGLGAAIEKAVTKLDENSAKLREIRDVVINRVLYEVPFSILNGDREKRLPGNANFAFRFIEGEGLLLFLDMYGIMASSGSACTSGSLDPSHVLLALGLKHEIAHGSLRLSFGTDLTGEDIDYVVNSIKTIVQRLRDMSPLYEDYLKNKTTEV